MQRITLHVGAGKCGSTAIQDALTRRAVIPLAAGGQANYTVIDKDGRVEAGDQVTPRRNGMSRRSADHAVLAALRPAPLTTFAEPCRRLRIPSSPRKAT